METDRLTGKRPGKKRERRGRAGKPRAIGIIFLILLVSLSLMVAAGEAAIRTAGSELRSRALETTRAEIGYISDALYSQLTQIQLQSTEILNSDTVLALAMRSAILDRYEVVSYENAIMKLIRSRLSQINLDASSQLYIPGISALITTQKAAAASEEELAEIREVIAGFPGGLFYTDEVMGFWSASPLIHDPARAAQSRVMLTRIRRQSLENLLRRYSSRPNGCRLLLVLNGHVIADSQETGWEESLPGPSDEEVRTVTWDGTPYYFIRTKHDFSDLSIAAVLPVGQVMSGLYRLQRLLRMLEIIGVLTVLLATAAFYQVICRPLRNISDKMRQVGGGDLSVRMGPESTAELTDVSLTFNRMAGRLQQLIDREYKSRLLAASAEKKALQYQITPHFLYNTYFQLRNLIMLEENEQAGRLADLMGRYLRYIVRQEDCAALEEEMDHAKNYADIQAMRFRGRIAVRCGVPDGDWKGLIVPRLIVQPLIENAFGHGLKNVEKDGLALITLRQTDREVLIRVEDNGEGLSEEALQALRRSVENGPGGENDGVALANIHRRLQLHFGPDSGLALDRSALGGLRAEIRIVPGKGGTEDAENPAGGR